MVAFVRLWGSGVGWQISDPWYTLEAGICNEVLEVPAELAVATTGFLRRFQVYCTICPARS